MDNFVITIARQYGSGGRTIGEELAKKLGISYYDKDIIRMASEESGIHEQLFGRADENVSTKQRFFAKSGIYKGELIPPQSKDFTSDENLFNYQAKVIRQLAETESCVIIGRCADYILKDDPDAYHIFVCGNEAEKIARTQKLFDLSEKEARNMNQDMDKKRRLHYEYYTDRKWGDFKNHCMILNTSVLGLERCIQYIVELIEAAE